MRKFSFSSISDRSEEAELTTTLGGTPGGDFVGIVLANGGTIGRVNLWNQGFSDNNGKGEAFSPTDLVAAALGTCMLTVMGIVAEKKGIDLGNATANVVKGMSSDLPRRIVKIEIVISVPLPGDHPEREALEAAALNCPVYHSVHADLEKAVSFQWG